MEGLHKLFTESYINIPEDKVDVLGELSAKLEEIQAKLDEQINKNIELSNIINEAEKVTTFDEVAEGLVATQVEKFRTLSEGVDFADVETYRKKLEVIKEQYFGKKEKAATNIVTEETEVTEPVAAPVPAHMAKYVSAISRTIK
jgi:predicted nuclease with TOPRIM domain